MAAADADSTLTAAELDADAGDASAGRELKDALPRKPRTLGDEAFHLAGGNLPCGARCGPGVYRMAPPVGEYSGEFEDTERGDTGAPMVFVLSDNSCVAAD